MLFNSLEYLLFFLPVCVFVFLLLNKKNIAVTKIWLIVCSLFFYTWWNPPYLILFLTSIVANYICSLFILDKSFKYKKWVLYVGTAFNIALIAYYKYINFIFYNIDQLFDIEIGSFNILLPLAISFFTFQQIAYLQDCNKGHVKGTGFIDYVLFVSFFPQLIAGPIVQFKDIVPQFYEKSFKSFSWEKLLSGLILIAIGLFKKVVIADYFSIWANLGFDNIQSLDFFKTWITSLSYTLQLYFDFSGYTDMALGAGLLFGIKLPQNFNSPYKSLSIQEFWRRWHITLGKFLRDYLYIPLGGNKQGPYRTLCNLTLVFFIAGIWHGAGWTFILWGLAHGVALVIHRIWSMYNISLNKMFSWLITFLFVNFAWVIFRAESLTDFKFLITKMCSPDTEFHSSYLLPAISAIIGVLICTISKNSDEYINEKTYSKPVYVLIASLATFTALSTITIWNANEFLYFRF